MGNTASDILRVGIVGYGNLGKGVENAIKQNPDMELMAIFTRRPPASIGSKAKVVSMDHLENYQNDIVVMVLCGGSSTDLPEQLLAVSKYFNTVDSFDTHAKIPAYFSKVNAHTKAHDSLILISTG